MAFYRHSKYNVERIPTESANEDIFFYHNLRYHPAMLFPIVLQECTYNSDQTYFSPVSALFQFCKLSIKRQPVCDTVLNISILLINCLLSLANGR